MPRPRTVPDADVLDGVERALHERGPHDFTLADVARETGLAPATLLQRFGSKHGLLVAFARRAVTTTSLKLDEAKPGLTAMRTALVELAAPLDDRRRMIHSLAFLLEDVRDPSLGAAAREQAEAMESAIERHLRAAIAAGELTRTDPAALTRVVHTAYSGAMILWAVRGQGSLRIAVGDAIDAVLAPYLACGRRRTDAPAVQAGPKRKAKTSERSRRGAPE